VMISTFGTGRLPETKISELVRRHFPLRPAEIVEKLDLLRPIYRNTAVGGHFGRSEPEFGWERTDKLEALKDDAGL